MNGRNDVRTFVITFLSGLLAVGAFLVVWARQQPEQPAPTAPVPQPVVTVEQPESPVSWDRVKADHDRRVAAEQAAAEAEAATAAAGRQAQAAAAAADLQQRWQTAEMIRAGMRAREEQDKANMEYQIQVDAANAAAAGRTAPQQATSVRPPNKVGR